MANVIDYIRRLKHGGAKDTPKMPGGAPAPKAAGKGKAKEGGGAPCPQAQEKSEQIPSCAQ